MVIRDYTRELVVADGFKLINIHDSSYPAHIWLYIFCGLMDSMWQTAGTCLLVFQHHALTKFTSLLDDGSNVK